MNILMVTNTYKPIVGGIERSIEVFSSEYRALGHKVLIVAPSFKNMPEEEGVHRIPAIQNFNGTDFSVEVPIHVNLKAVLDDFSPDIVHSHHPFLAGDTALRISSVHNIPIVFTYHTMYELNTHYVPGDSEVLKKFVVQLALGYSELCDRVIAPSLSVKNILKKRGLAAEVEVVPTGINVSQFASGNGVASRKERGIPEKDFVIGYLGRIAGEKNMAFLADSVFPFIAERKNTHFMVVGEGDLLADLKKKAASSGSSDRVHFTGTLRGAEKINAYHAMDVFTFASKSETQGLVLAEAMASGVPVIGLDAPGVRDIVKDGVNGVLLEHEDPKMFSGALGAFCDMPVPAREKLIEGAKNTAKGFDYGENAKKVLKVYEEAIKDHPGTKNTDKSVWESSRRYIKAETELISNVVRSAGAAFKEDRPARHK